MSSIGNWMQVILGACALAWAVVAFRMIFLLRGTSADRLAAADRGPEPAHDRGSRNSQLILWTGLAITCLLVFVALPAAGWTKVEEVAVMVVGCLASVTASLAVGLKAARRARSTM